MSEFVVDLWAVWYQPLIGALHMLGIAWFGASLFVKAPRMRRVGLVWMLLTGALLFAANAERVLASTSFRVKMGLMVAAVLVSRPRWLVVGLWAAVIFAARGIAYF